MLADISYMHTHQVHGIKSTLPVSSNPGKASSHPALALRDEPIPAPSGCGKPKQCTWNREVLQVSSVACGTPQAWDQPAGNSLRLLSQDVDEAGCTGESTRWDAAETYTFSCRQLNAHMVTASLTKTPYWAVKILAHEIKLTPPRQPSPSSSLSPPDLAVSASGKRRSVATMPGDTRCTLTGLPCTEAASEALSWTSACFVAPYTGFLGVASPRDPLPAMRKNCACDEGRWGLYGGRMAGSAGWVSGRLRMGRTFVHAA